MGIGLVFLFIILFMLGGISYLLTNYAMRFVRSEKYKNIWSAVIFLLTLLLLGFITFLVIINNITLGR